MHKTLPDNPRTLPKPTLWHLAGSAALVLTVAACAAVPQPPSTELQAAQAAIESVEQARVADYASPELGEARDKLNAANAAVQLKEMDIARRYAEQSEADAQLALARSQATKARLVNEEMLKSTNTIKVEMQRNPGVQP
jgi:putative cell wall-binding protein